MVATYTRCYGPPSAAESAAFTCSPLELRRTASAAAPVSNNTEARPERALSFLPSWPLSTSVCKQLCVVARRALLALTHLDRYQCRQQTDAAPATSRRGTEGRIRHGSALGHHRREIERGGCRTDYLRLYPCLASWHPCSLPKLSPSRGRKLFWRRAMGKGTRAVYHDTGILHDGCVCCKILNW
jgi:hypothetical protein